jgi:nitrate/nitrite transporter NarK
MDKRALVSGCAAGFAFSAVYTNHAPMISVLRAQFGFDQTAAGLLTTGVFLSHALFQTPGGRLADRFGPVRVMSAALAWVTAANLGLAFAGAYWQLLGWKIFAGFGTAACFTAGARHIVAQYKGRELHLAQGFYGGSIVLGSGFVLFAVPRLLSAFGWRAAFIGSAIPAIAVWVWWMAAAPQTPHVASPAGGLGKMMRHGELWLLGLTQMASFGLVIVVGSWITTLLKNTFQMTLQTAGLLGSVVLLLGMISRPLGGWLARRAPPGKLIAASLALNAVACAALARAPSPALAFAAILAMGVGCGLPYAATFNRAAALYPASPGAAMGLVNTIGISMILIGAPAVGYLADWTGQFRASFYALGVFSASAACAALAIPERK